MGGQMGNIERCSDGRIVRRGAYPELTWTAVIVGYFLGAIITLSVGYAALILGFGIRGSDLAAILGFGILRGIMRRTSIVENNINQTIASAVNGASSGMMFSIPALFILNQTNFDPYLMVISCIAGGILGIAFIIPLRKQMIDYNRLVFPEAVAVATILKSPGAGVKKAILLASGIGLSGIIHFVTQHYGFEDYHVGNLLGLPSYSNVVFYISIMTVAVGYISGKGGLTFVIGGFVCYWLVSPILSGLGLLPSPEVLAETGKSMPSFLRLMLYRPLGIGMLIGGALTGIVFAVPLIRSAIVSMHTATKTKKSITKDEMPIKLLYIAIGVAFVVLTIIAYKSVVEMSLLRGIIMAVLGTVWVWVASVIVSECLGRTSWSPLSGMTLIAVTILVLVASGMGDSAAIISSIMVGAAVCIALCQAGDMMQDLKVGYLVGASPYKQQVGQFLATWLGPILIMVLIFVLHEAYGLGSEKLPAPQGQALASMISGILGGNVPVAKYIAGGVLGALLSSSGMGGLGVLVGLGFYLPFSIVLTYSIGLLIRILVDWKKGGQGFSHNVGIPFAAGLIVGEALVGVGYAMYNVIAGAMG